MIIGTEDQLDLDQSKVIRMLVRSASVAGGDDEKPCKFDIIVWHRDDDYYAELVTGCLSPGDLDGGATLHIPKELAAELGSALLEASK
jgi:hypothetical protein